MVFLLLSRGGCLLVLHLLLPSLATALLSSAACFSLLPGGNGGRWGVEGERGRGNTPAAEAAGGNTLLPVVADRHTRVEDRRSRAGGRRRAVGIDLPLWWVGEGLCCFGVLGTGS